MTMHQHFPVTSNYETVKQGLLRMHHLSCIGEFESPEADAVRDAMDEPWEGLSNIEKKRIEGLSRDLNSISETTSSSHPWETNPQAQAKVFETCEAWSNGEWDRALDLLRQGEMCAPPATVSYLRGLIWRAAGDVEIAAIFFEYASRPKLDNANCNCEDLFLNVLKSAHPV